jgi:hypothetical protein
MLTKAKLYTGQKGKVQRSPPFVDGLRFSCAGEGCVTKEKCARWDHIYKEKFGRN